MRISIRHAFVGAIVGLVLTTVAATYVFARISGEAAMRDQMESILLSDTDQASLRTMSFLTVAENAATSAEIPIADTTDLAHTEAHYLDALRYSPSLDAVFTGTPDGTFLFASRDPDELPGGYFIKTIQTEPNRVVTYSYRDAEGTVVDTHEVEGDLYDPRQRPWYVEAVAGGETVWTDPYVFFTSQEPGITVGTPLYGESGQLTGVAGVDVTLDGISGFLSDLNSSPNSSAALFDPEGRIVAMPGGAPVIQDGSGGLTFVDASEADDPLIHDAFLALESAQDGDSPDTNELFTSFAVDGVTYGAAFRQLPHQEVNWTIGVFAPESDYLGSVRENASKSASLAALIGLIGAVAGWVLARRLTKPLETLTKLARRILEGRDVDGLVVDTRMSEIAETSKALDAARSELEGRVAARTAALNEEVQVRTEAEIAAQAASEAKTQFLSTMGHEIRTPLTGIIGAASLLEEGVDAETTELLIGDIRNSGEHLMSIVNDTLDIARIESNQLDLEPEIVSAADLVNDTLAMMKHQMANRQLTTTVEIQPVLPRLHVDQRRMKQVLLNLISNAVKYTPPGGTITVSAFESDKSVQLTVSDSGVGMTEDQIEVALSLYGRVQRTASERIEGTGIGLHLTQRLVEAHQGRLEVTSDPGAGTTALVVLPPERMVREPADA